MISRLLNGSTIPPDELYRLLNRRGTSDLNGDGGLGSAFKKETMDPLVSKAFSINASVKPETAAVKDIVKLHELAHKFKNGQHNKKRQANYNKYVLCLALICYQQTNSTVAANVDLRIIQLTLQELADFYSINDRKNDNYTLIQKKLAAYHEILKQSTVAPSEIVKKDAAFKNHSLHSARSVVVQDAKTQETRRYILKRNVNPRVANLEVFCGTMMELYIGPHQPSTRQVCNTMGSMDVLSEQIEFTPFADQKTFQAWAEKGFPDAAVLDVANLFLEENDDHEYNGGIRKDNQLPIRIDFDQTCATIVCQIADPNAAHVTKKQRVDDTIYEINELGKTEGYDIHEKDLENLPVLLSVLDDDFEFEKRKDKRYIPYNRWTNCVRRNRELTDQIEKLRTQPEYQTKKFRSILEKIIMPDEIIRLIANATLFNLTDKHTALTRFEYKRKKMQATVLRVPYFLAYMYNESYRGIEELKTRFRAFCTKRSDIISPDSVNRLLNLYHRNYLAYMETLAPELEFYRPRPARQAAPVAIDTHSYSQTALLKTFGLKNLYNTRPKNKKKIKVYTYSIRSIRM